MTIGATVACFPATLGNCAKELMERFPNNPASTAGRTYNDYRLGDESAAKGILTQFCVVAGLELVQDVSVIGANCFDAK